MLYIWHKAVFWRIIFVLISSDHFTFNKMEWQSTVPVASGSFLFLVEKSIPVPWNYSSEDVSTCCLTAIEVMIILLLHICVCKYTLFLCTDTCMFAAVPSFQNVYTVLSLIKKSWISYSTLSMKPFFEWDCSWKFGFCWALYMSQYMCMSVYTLYMYVSWYVQLNIYQELWTVVSPVSVHQTLWRLDDIFFSISTCGFLLFVLCCLLCSKQSIAISFVAVT